MGSNEPVAAPQTQEQTQGAISIAGIHDPNGASLVMEADAAIQRVEDFLQQHLMRTGDVPGKAAKVIIELDILATGKLGRTIDWSVDTKFPSTAVKRVQQAASDGTQIRPMQLPQQHKIDFSTGEVS